MYSIKNRVTTSYCGSDGCMKLYSALLLMQDCSELWIESEPDYQRFFIENNMAQLLASRQVEVIRKPKYKEELTVTTSVYDMTPMYGFRNTFIYDADGKVCYKSYSIGAFVDMVNKKLHRIDEDVINTITIDDKLDMNYRERRISIPKTEPKQCHPIEILRSDIDYNNHVNNVSYTRMALDLLPNDFEPREMRVEYKSQTRFGDTLQPMVYAIDNGYVVVLMTNGQVCTIVEFLA